MTTSPFWRKAFFLSLIIHCAALLLLGWGWAKNSSAPLKERLIEIDFAASSLPSRTAHHESAAVTPAGPAPVSTSPDRAHTVAPSTATHSPAPPSTSEGAGVVDSASVGSITASSGDNATEQISAGKGTGSAIAATPTITEIIPPSVLSRTEPHYPDSARRNGQQGIVGLRIEILPNGRPGEISVEQSCGFSALDDSAVRAARSWRFTPAKEYPSGHAIACTTTVSIVFKLK